MLLIGEFQQVKKPDRSQALDWLCYASEQLARRQAMHINTKYRLGALFYLMAAYAIALPLMALILDVVIGGSLIDIWKGSYSFSDLLNHREDLYLMMAGLGAAIGFVYWLFFYRKYQHYDPMDKYFK
nr:hypothetical protein [Atlantibacter hermannii]